MHFILLSDVENDQTDAILEGNLTDPEIEDFSFASGHSVKINKSDLPIFYVLDEYTLRGRMTDHLSIDNIPGSIFSEKTKSVLEKREVKNIEYYQLTLLDEFVKVQIGTPKKPQTELKTIKYTNYFIANVVGLIDCVDHEKSILEYFYPPELRSMQNETQESNDEINNPFAGENPNEIDFITKLVLDESKIDPTLKIFRLKDQPNLLLFHESIVDQIKKEKLSGFVFVPVEEYTDAIPDDEKAEQEIKEPEQKKVIAQSKQTVVPTVLKQNEESSEIKKRRFFFE